MCNCREGIIKIQINRKKSNARPFQQRCHSIVAALTACSRASPTSTRAATRPSTCSGMRPARCSTSASEPQSQYSSAIEIWRRDKGRGLGQGRAGERERGGSEREAAGPCVPRADQARLIALGGVEGADEGDEAGVLGRVDERLHLQQQRLALFLLRDRDDFEREHAAGGQVDGFSHDRGRAAAQQVEGHEVLLRQLDRHVAARQRPNVAAPLRAGKGGGDKVTLIPRWFTGQEAANRSRISRLHAVGADGKSAHLQRPLVCDVVRALRRSLRVFGARLLFAALARGAAGCRRCRFKAGKQNLWRPKTPAHAPT